MCGKKRWNTRNQHKIHYSVLESNNFRPTEEEINELQTGVVSLMKT